MIAALALSLQATLITNNTREFARVRSLQLSELRLGGESTQGVGLQQVSIKARKASQGTVASISSKKRWPPILFLA